MTKQTSIRKVALGIMGAGVVATAAWWLAAPSSHSITTQAPAVTATRSHAAPSTPSLSGAANVRVDARVSAALVDYATRPATAVALELSGAERGRSAMRAWTSRVMNLDNANQRHSTRFDRISYTNPQARDVPMYLADRRRANGSFGDSAASTGWVSVVYRESTNGREMLFEKLGKDQQHKPTGAGIPEQQATEQARAFVLENGLIAESGSDVIGRREVRERHENQEQASGELDFLVQQDIVLRRMFEGKPVINASASIGVLAAGNEIVMVKVSNWTPVSSSSDARTEIKPAYDGPRAQKLAEQLEVQLGAVLKDQLGEDADGAIVKDMEESWFSSDRDGMIPALVFAVELGDASGDRHTVAVAMTPYHDSAQIWEQGRKVRTAAVEPANAEVVTTR